MKNILFLLSVAFAAGLSVSCGGEKGASEFGETVELRADSIAIHEILQPNSWVATGGKAVVGAKKGSDSLVYVYGLPEFKFLYKGIRTGGGPGELANPYAELIQRYDENGHFILYHFGSGRMYYFMAADTGFVVESAKQLTRNGSGKGYSGGELLVDSDIPWDADPNIKQNVYLYLYDISTGNTLDTVLSQSVFSPTPGKNYGAFKNGTISLYNDSLCAIVYDKTGRVEYYDISSGKLALKGFTGNDTPVEQLREVDFDTWEGPFYAEAATDGKYLYVLEMHYKDDIKFDCYVLVYDWEGKSIKKYRLDKIIDNIIAGEGKLYGYNEKKDFEQVYVFDLGL